MNIFSLRNSKIIGVVAILILGGVAYALWGSGTPTPTTTAALVAHQVTTGTVTSGIQTTGKIVAADILDLNVYKLTNRIDEVRVINGAHVEKGQLLFSFDQSDVSVDIVESEIGIREAELLLAVQQGAAKDQNTTITTLMNDIEVLEKKLAQYPTDKVETLRTFLNSNLEAIPTDVRYNAQISRVAPVIGGLYTHTEQGEYSVRLYASGEASGYSYELKGIESGVYPVYLGVETKLGTRGLTITFPASSTTRDEWIIAVPNKYASEYVVNVEDYKNAIIDIDKNIDTDTVTLANKKIQLEQERRGDTVPQRALDVESASLAIEKAQVNLQKGIDTLTERRIVAPFSGTIEGMENVVVGATPTKDSNDSINFGSLISDDFMTTFSLSANDVTKVTLGQKVLVTLSSVPGSSPLEAEVVEISSLPDSSTVAQYEVLARIAEDDVATYDLRDGMLADIEIVQEEKLDVLRVPVSAVQYSEGKANVTILEGLSGDQHIQVEQMGILRTEGSTHTSYSRPIELGLRGQYYVEVLSGLEAGELLEVTSTNGVTEGSVVETQGFGPPGGGSGRIREEGVSPSGQSPSQGAGAE
ncbi:MAG: Secretion protein HlyD [Parcubacteria group bacterium GW2011_GWA2_43_11]|nr:MAG: Secretion protein HlyD [Parcubacteria group bacterium GW2011_GWC2_42_11]KKS85019.1 MAG: Secretion protein HlyD [Parcubacteria group bacterium GW2011_GWA2_43_11]